MCTFPIPTIIFLRGEATRDANTSNCVYSDYIELPENIENQLCTVRMVSAATSEDYALVSLNWNQIKSYAKTTTANGGIITTVNQGRSFYLGLTNDLSQSPLLTMNVPSQQCQVELTFNKVTGVAWTAAEINFVVALEIIPLADYK